MDTSVSEAHTASIFRISDWGMYVVDYIVKLQCMSVGGRGGKEVHKDLCQLEW